MKPFYCFAVAFILAGICYYCLAFDKETKICPLKEVLTIEENIKEIKKDSFLDVERDFEGLRPTCREKHHGRDPLLENARFFMASALCSRLPESELRKELSLCDTTEVRDSICVFGKDRDLLRLKIDECECGVYIDHKEGRVTEVISVMKEENPGTF